MNQAILKILDDLVVDELKDWTITYNLWYNRAIEDAQDKILDLPSLESKIMSLQRYYHEPEYSFMLEDETWEFIRYDDLLNLLNND